MEYQVEIERMTYGPSAIAHLPNGKALFVDGVAPGDIAKVQLTEEKKSFARGRMTELLEASPLRVAPRSPLEALCGTAPWQQLTYSAQLEAKRQNLVNALVRGEGWDQEKAETLISPVAPSERQWNYRNKLELGAGNDSQGRLILGFHQEETHELIAVDSSPLAHKALEKLPKALQGALRYAQGSRDLGIYRVGIRHSLATKDLEVALWTPPGAFPRATFAKTLASAVNPTGIVRVLAQPGKARKVKGVEVLQGHSHWHEKLGAIDYHTQAPSFFQVNTGQAQHLVELVCQEMGDVNGAYIADLFAGGGTFSIPLAKAGADVVAVEAAGSSVRDLRANAERNQVDIEVIGGDAHRELAQLGPLDELVVDPPRAGLGPQLIEDIAGAHPGSLIYVSCDPATWARDVTLLTSQGYHLRKALPVDMFPQTYHAEIVSLFQPA